MSEKTKEKLKGELMRYEIELKSLKKEISDNYEKLKETDLTENDKDELEIKIEKEIESEEDLKYEKERIENKLNILIQEEKNAKIGNILRDVHELENRFGDNTNILEDDNRRNQKYKIQKERKRALEREGKNIMRGPENKYERKKKLEKYFAKANS